MDKILNKTQDPIARIAAADSYAVTGRTMGANMTDRSGEIHYGAMFNVFHNGTQFNGFCVDMGTCMAYGSNDQQASNMEITTQVHPAKVNLLRWIANHSMPFLSLAQLQALTGIATLTEEQAFQGTQGAIWNLLGTVPFTLGSTNPANALSMYSFILNNVGAGWTKDEVWIRAQPIEIRFDLTQARLIAQGNNHLIGPIQIYANGALLVNKDFHVSVQCMGCVITITDDYGNPITAVNDGNLLYLSFDAHDDPSKITLSADVDRVTYGADAIVLVADDGIKASPSVFVMQPLQVAPHSEVALDLYCFDMFKYAQSAETEMALAGAHFDLRSTEGDTLLSLVTNNAGEITFYGLMPGEYRLVETQPPDGYLPNPDPIPVIVPRSGSSVDRRVRVLNVENSTQSGGRIHLRKRDACRKNHGLPDAWYLLRDATGKEIAMLTTDARGEALSSTLAPGKYTLEEVLAPNGYRLDPTRREVEILEGQTIETVVTINDYPKPCCSSEFGCGSPCGMGGECCQRGGCDPNGYNPNGCYPNGERDPNGGRDPNSGCLLGDDW